MKTSFELVADPRDGVQGKGASRRLRRSGKVPAILYGGHSEPRQLILDHQNLLTLLVNERFYLDDPVAQGQRRDAGGHPQGRAASSGEEPDPAHRSAARAREREDPHAHSAALQGRGGLAGREDAGRRRVAPVERRRSQLCLPKDLPEFLEVDMSAMQMNDMKRLSDIPLPAGVELVDLAHGRDEPVVSIHHPRAEEVEARRPRLRPLRRAPAAGAAPAAAAAPAAGGDAKKEEAQAGCWRCRRRRRQEVRRRSDGRQEVSRMLACHADALADDARRGVGLCSRHWHRFVTAMAGTPLKIIVGLGNPGPEHLLTRHNAGFWFVDALAAKLGARFRSHTRFQGEICRVAVVGRRDHAAQADDVHESQRARDSRARRLSEGLAGAKCWSCTTSSICRSATCASSSAAAHGGHNGLRDTITHIGAGFLAPAPRHRTSGRQVAGDRLRAAARAEGRGRTDARRRRRCARCAAGVPRARRGARDERLHGSRKRA